MLLCVDINAFILLFYVSSNTLIHRFISRLLLVIIISSSFFQRFYLLGWKFLTKCIYHWLLGPLEKDAMSQWSPWCNFLNSYKLYAHKILVGIDCSAEFHVVMISSMKLILILCNFNVWVRSIHTDPFTKLWMVGRFVNWLSFTRISSTCFGIKSKYQTGSINGTQVNAAIPAMWQSILTFGNASLVNC
jgi:hypothetical protein